MKLQFLYDGLIIIFLKLMQEKVTCSWTTTPNDLSVQVGDVNISYGNATQKLHALMRISNYISQDQKR